MFSSVNQGIYVPDFNALTQGAVTRFVGENSVTGRIVLHRSVIQLIEYFAYKGKVLGQVGLDEVKKLREMHEKGVITLEIVGEKIRGIVDEDSALLESNTAVRELAASLRGTLLTGDKFQYEIAKSLGIDVVYLVKEEDSRLEFEKYFTEDTMSIHLKEGVPPIAKVGRPGEWRFLRISEVPVSREDLEKMANEIIEAAKRRVDAFIEIDRVGSTIVQLGQYRIVITRPPLSDGWEITAVKPVKKMRLEDYNLPPELLKRFNERAEGILIAGAPGMGKTTFAQALAEYYMRMNKVVKTIESPRDMLLPPEITQYSKNYADLSELHDILLLSRPDYTVFDEMRNDEDFKLFADLRLAGIGMIGVVHATSPIDAIQRFIGRVELGMIPSIIDTVIFLRNGYVDKVYEVKMTVKLPTGLKEAELSRPVIEVRDFMTGELEYEIYTFGEQTVVVPVKKLRVTKREGSEALVSKLSKILPEADIRVEEEGIVVTIPRHAMRKYNRRIDKIKALEEKYGLPIRIRVS